MVFGIGGSAGASAEATKLRVGSYRIGEGSPRPFVYVPKDFDLGAPGAIGQVLEALGVKEALGQTAPSMVLRVSKATMPPVHDTAAVREEFSESLDGLTEHQKEKLCLPVADEGPVKSGNHLFSRSNANNPTKQSEVTVPETVVLLSPDDATVRTTTPPPRKTPSRRRRRPAARADVS